MIESSSVLVIGAAGEKMGTLGLAQALDAARAAGLDLVEVSPHARPPVCKILDYGKYKYQAQKKANVARKKQKVVDVKEVKIRPNIDTHDYEVKLRNVLRFLEAGDKVKVTVRFRGREMAHPDLGAKLLRRLCAALVEKAKIESPAKMERRQLTMMLIPASHNGGKPIELDRLDKAIIVRMPRPEQAPEQAASDAPADGGGAPEAPPPAEPSAESQDESQSDSAEPSDSAEVAADSPEARALSQR